MLRSLFCLFLILSFTGVQSLASVCKTKCSLVETVKTEKKDSKSEHQNCHSTEDPSENTKSDEECGSICQSDDLIKGEAEVGQFSAEIPKLIAFSKQIEIDLLNRELSFVINTHDPPGHSFHHGVAIFIQKSSFLI